MLIIINLNTDDEEAHAAVEASISTSMRSHGSEEGPRVTVGTRRQKEGVPKKDIDPTKLLQEILCKPSPATKSDLTLKFTKVNRNLSPATLIENALSKEKGTYLMSSGALATLSGTKGHMFGGCEISESDCGIFTK